MLKPISKLLTAVVLALVAYLLLWPVAVDPVKWSAPRNEGYTGDFVPNDAMAGVSRIPLLNYSGPEDAAIGPDGRVFMASHEGAIVSYDPSTGTVEAFAGTGGRPLGVEFARDGTLYVADAYRGLLAITPEGVVSVVADKTAQGSPILFADDLDIAPDGSVFFTDASTKFGVEASGGTLEGSFLDLMEHGGHGRVLRYDPTSASTTVVVEGLNFANGLAMTATGTHFLVIETGEYAVKKISLDGTESEVILGNLPGFPDNINRNADGSFWLGLVSPRSGIADALSTKPFLRKVIMRLPAALRPAAQRYGFVVKIDEDGNVLETLQDPTGQFALTTGLIEGRDGVRYITSLSEPDLGVLKP
jgi:sugar lactone lactonase YvrE